MNPEKCEKSVIKNYYGCPCQNDCCNKPDITTPKHKCKGEFCDECYGSECISCGSICYCDL